MLLEQPLHGLQRAVAAAARAVRVVRRDVELHLIGVTEQISEAEWQEQPLHGLQRAVAAAARAVCVIRQDVGRNLLVVGR